PQSGDRRCPGRVGWQRGARPRRADDADRADERYEAPRHGDPRRPVRRARHQLPRRGGADAHQTGPLGGRGAGGRGRPRDERRPRWTAEHRLDTVGGGGALRRARGGPRRSRASMTQWGFALLIAYVALGTSRMTWRNAGRAALFTTAA